MKRVFASLFVLFVLSVGLADAADQPISEAEQAVFLADHLGGLPHKQSLRYSFERSGALEKPFKDEVTMSVSPWAIRTWSCGSRAMAARSMLSDSGL